MKVGILTFHAAHNYGSMLLAYALQEALMNLGHDPYIINHRILAQNMMYANPLKFKHTIHVKSAIMHPVQFIGQTKKWYKFEEFSSKYHRLTKVCSSLRETSNVIDENNFDVVIAGGDQIWNMQCSDFSIAYYLPFERKGTRKISYAPSFGGGGAFKIDDYSNAIAGLLDSFSYISVREQSASENLSTLMQRDIKTVCDPTLLLTNKEYEHLAGDKPLINGKYIFYYSPFSTPETEFATLQLSKKHAIPVVTSNGEYYTCKGMRKVLNAGPIEFLNLIKNSAMICGNSFHLVAFSILFNKEFIIFSKADARMENLMKRLGIKGHFYPSFECIPETLEKIDWSIVNQELENMRKEGLLFLKTALS